MKSGVSGSFSPWEAVMKWPASCPKNPVDGLVLFVKFPARLTDLEQQA
jgi:hypothetical protein